MPQELLNQLEKFSAICHAIHTDPVACDLKVSFFCVAAAWNYRQGESVKPSPSKFSKLDDVDMEGLIGVLKKIPPLTEVANNEPEMDVVDFLHWLLVQQMQPQVVRVNPSDVRDVLEKFNWDKREIRPTHIFRIAHAAGSAAEMKFREFAEHFPTQWAFHGSRVHNFHSILHFGLAQHLNKRSAFGEGIYLSTDLSVSLTYSPLEPTWTHSQLGQRFSCVALCEYIEHPDHFKCHSTSRKSEIPKNFIVVTNNETIRVRYLLLYAKASPRRQPNRGPIEEWMVQNKATLLIISYAFILLAVNLCSSSNSWWADIRNIAGKFFPNLFNS
ncbi:protein mono-ADP-ribosyltransferase PARP16 [Lutzomyia longipalpis]|nr:protein mono-ADP-ribosyltransferase PARP16 [Lutzomyia longipalpis]